MSYLVRLDSIYETLRADMASGYCMSGGEETFASWDAMLTITLELWAQDPVMAGQLPELNPERWTFAGENCDYDYSAAIAKRLDLVSSQSEE